MRYNPDAPIAVFLGPSLPLAQARRILEANYYPPVRMGDIYRLLATGVETIAIIDGVFHQSTPVWQREILSALSEGIAVVGGASMGALRAAELAPHGMLGIGTVYAWYRDGDIDGDDEVALLHADASLAYRALSEPLVNLRFNLARACVRGLITDEERAALLAEVQGVCFTQRSWNALSDTGAWKNIALERQRTLQAFIDEELEDVKQQDAVMVLEHCVTPACSAPRSTSAGYWSYPGTVREQIQCAVAHDGDLVSAAQVLQKAASDSQWLAHHDRLARQQFFLLDWLAARNVVAAPELIAERVRNARTLVAGSDVPSWLRANGMTAYELDCELEQRTQFAWLCEHDPRAFGVDFNAATRLAAVFATTTGQPVRTLTQALLVECYLADWARTRGIVCPPHESARRAAAWEFHISAHERADWLQQHGLQQSDFKAVLDAHCLADWVMECGPYYFGYLTWSPETYLLHQLRLEGRYLDLVARAISDLRAADITAQNG